MSEKVGIRNWFNYSKKQWLIIFVIAALFIIIPDILGHDTFNNIMLKLIMSLLFLLGIVMIMTPFILFRGPRKIELTILSKRDFLGIAGIIIIGIICLFFAIYVLFYF
jgi:hypothetical protein